MGAAIDSDKDVAFSDFAIGRSQLRKMLHVDVDEAKVIVGECPLAARGNSPLSRRPAAKPGILQNAPDAVPVEVRQKVAHDESQIIKSKIGRTTKVANNRPFLYRCLPCQLLRRPERSVQASIPRRRHFRTVSSLIP